MYLVANLNTPAPLNLGDRDRLDALIRTASAGRLSTIMAFFNVAYLTSPQAVEYPGLVLVREPHAPLQPFVYEVTNVTPRSFVPRRILPVQSAEQALNHLRTSEDPATEVAVAAEAIPSGLPATQLGRVRLAAHLPDRVELQAEMETPGLVVLSDAFYPGWKAEVNGAAATIVRVNEFVRGVFVSAGSQRIIFEYNPPAYQLGLAITGAFAAGLAGLSFWRSGHRGGRRCE
jgi:Bacterial membrane protein YfhO